MVLYMNKELLRSNLCKMFRSIDFVKNVKKDTEVNKELKQENTTWTRQQVHV